MTGLGLCAVLVTCDDKDRSHVECNRDDSLFCTPRDYVCDGVVTCDQAAHTTCDKRNCTDAEFACDGRCIPWSRVCDGHNDCVDDTDENNATCSGRPTNCFNMRTINTLIYSMGLLAMSNWGFNSDVAYINEY